MKLPSKIISYNESVLCNMGILLKIISANDVIVSDLYEKVKRKIEFNDFIDALDALFYLNKIAFFESGEVLHYVN